MAHPPASLYIHIPWCVKKCPYCDFNSHQQRGELPEKPYLQALIRDFDQRHHLLLERPIQSIFIGGGTPSLFHPKHIASLLTHIKQKHPCLANMEITMEANPGTLEHYPFVDLLEAGVNRLSIGVQSFDPLMLQRLGRIHNNDEAHSAI